MTPILELTDTWNRFRRVQVLRPLNKDDFDIKEYTDIPEEHVDENGKERSSISCRYVISLKVDRLKHLMEIMGIETRDYRGKDMYARRECMVPLTDDWYPSPRTVYVEASEKMSYKGIPKANKERRQDRYDQIREVVLNDWEETKAMRLDEKINSLWTEFRHRINRLNEDFDEDLTKSVRDLNINDKWLKKRRGETGKEIAAELKKTEKKMAKLRELRKELDVRMCNYDRALVCDFLTGPESDFSPETKERVNDLRDESFGKIADTRRRGLMI